MSVQSWTEGTCHSGIQSGAVPDGPAGLAAGVCAASAGLNVLIVEADTPGGQAASSSRIENYLGFPTDFRDGNWQRAP